MEKELPKGMGTLSKEFSQMGERELDDICELLRLRAFRWSMNAHRRGFVFPKLLFSDRVNGHRAAPVIICENGLILPPEPGPLAELIKRYDDQVILIDAVVMNPRTMPATRELARVKCETIKGVIKDLKKLIE